ncbi:MAG: NACHT domain-containing protein [Spirochaetales bacterium]|nr:NACHT domain-containing protein [Spirochaetales bacterium]
MKTIETISLFISNPVQVDTPEVYSFTTLFAEALKQAQIEAEITLKSLSVPSLHDTAAWEPDLVITIGHGLESGKLVFEKETLYRIFPEFLSFSDLDQTAQSVFLHAQAVLVFACYGAVWCKGIPEHVSWISFEKSILQRATTVFVQQILNYNAKSIFTAVQNANRLMDYIDDDAVTCSKHDPGHYPCFKKGKGLSFTTVSPSIAGKAFLDSLEIQSTTNNFHGRKKELVICTNPPSGKSRLPLQRVTWIYGEAGMGKSALVKKTYEYLSHHWYAFAHKPPAVLCVNMRKATSIAEAEKEITDFICRKILIDCPDREVKDRCDLNNCFSNLSKTTGPVTLILDDLTYIDMTEKPENAAQLVQIILDCAKDNNLIFHLIVTCRNKPVSHNAHFFFLHLEPLDMEDVAAILQEKFPRGIGSPVKIAALFAQVQFNTFRFFALIQRREAQCVDDIIKDILRGYKNIRLELEQIDRELVQQEWEYAPKLGKKKHINWPGFLLTLYPLSIQRWLRPQPNSGKAGNIF